MNSLAPNTDSLPSMPTNDPFFMGNVLDMGQVSEITALGAPDGSSLITPQGPINNLASLRKQFPFLPILPFPTEVMTIILDVANTAKDLRVPSGAALFMPQANADFYMSISGRAEVPSLSTAQGDMSDNSNTSKSFLNPKNVLLYCNGLNSLSVISPTVNCIVTLLFWAPSDMPR